MMHREHGMRGEKLAFLSMEKAARKDRARGLEAIKAPNHGQTVPPLVAVSVGRRAWESSRARMRALRHLRGRGR